jgi:uncharacterized repeat protein (TIGR01451 family)
MLIPVNYDNPEWKQIGTVINSRNNTRLTVEFLSEGPAAIGNDYAIDDISLVEITVPDFTTIKTISVPYAEVGEIVTYTVSLSNTYSSPLTEVLFKDALTNGLSFVSGSVLVNDVPQPTADPNVGFIISDIEGNGIHTAN